MPGGIDPAIVGLPGHRFGDGLVYMRGAAERAAFRRAVALGLVSSEGYPIPEGLALASRHDPP